jgi:hypothetical protein
MWTLIRYCTDTCSYRLTRVLQQTSGYPFLTADLVRRSDGWEAVWPAMMEPCGGNSLAPITWAQREVWMLRFTDLGRQVVVHGDKFSFNPRCGYGQDTTAWRAKMVIPTYTPPHSGSSVTAGNPA